MSHVPTVYIKTNNLVHLIVCQLYMICNFRCIAGELLRDGMTLFKEEYCTVNGSPKGGHKAIHECTSMTADGTETAKTELQTALIANTETDEEQEHDGGVQDIHEQLNTGKVNQDDPAKGAQLCGKKRHLAAFSSASGETETRRYRALEVLQAMFKV